MSVYKTGDFQQARRYLEQSLKMKHALNGDKDHPSSAATLHALGYVSLQTGDFQQARQYLAHQFLELFLKVVHFCTVTRPL